MARNSGAKVMEARRKITSYSSKSLGDGWQGEGERRNGASDVPQTNPQESASELIASSRGRGCPSDGKSHYYQGRCLYCQFAGLFRLQPAPGAGLLPGRLQSPASPASVVGGGSENRRKAGPPHPAHATSYLGKSPIPGVATFSK